MNKQELISDRNKLLDAYFTLSHILKTIGDPELIKDIEHAQSVLIDRAVVLERHIYPCRLVNVTRIECKNGACFE